MKDSEPASDPSAEHGSSFGDFAAMAASYGMGVFNDNFYRQATLLLAVVAGQNWYPGTAMAVFALPYLLLSAAAGWLADRFPKRNVIIGAKGLEIAAMILGAAGVLWQSWGLMLGMVCLMGTQSALFNPALAGSIPELFPREAVTRVNARLRVAITAAILFGVVCAGVALEAEGMIFEIFPAGRLAVALIVLVVAVLGCTASFAIPWRKAKNPDAAFPWKGPWETLKELWRIRRDPELSLAIGVICLVFFLGAVQILIVNEMGIRQFGLGEGLTSAMNFATLLGVAIGGLISDRLTERWRWDSTMLPLAGVLCAAFLMLALVPLFPDNLQVSCVYLLLTLGGIAGGLMLIPAQAFVQVRPASERRGAVIAATNFACFAGILLSGPIGGGCLKSVRPLSYPVMRLLDTFAGRTGAVSVMMASYLMNPTTVFAFLAFLTILVTYVLVRRVSDDSGPTPVDSLIALGIRFLLSLRYRINVRGLDQIEKNGDEGIVFLPNHPALIDPIILLAILYPRFAPRAWAIDYQVDRFFIRDLARRVGVMTFPPVERDPEEAKKVFDDLIQRTVSGLENGENYLMYPSGHVYRTGQEDLRGNSAAHDVLRECPRARAVLVRTTGLWGSSFSWANGHAPKVSELVKESIKHLLMNGIFFSPRRCVTIEFTEPDELPRNEPKNRFNAALERFYNRTSHPPLYVPYTVWEPGPPARFFEEPGPKGAQLSGAHIPEGVRQRVKEHLREVSGIQPVESDDHLGRDLGIDSVGRAELLAWVESEWGETVGDAESVQTVEDLMLAAMGQAPGGEAREVEPPPQEWFDRVGQLNDALEKADTLDKAFLHSAESNPGMPIFADQRSGVLTYRRMLTAIFAMKPHVDDLSDKIGIMLPASVGAAVAYLTAMTAGKTPVMVNWTLGRRAVNHCMETAGVEHILTARALMEELEKEGTTFPDLEEKFVYLEDVRRDIGMLDKCIALFRAVFRSGSLLEPAVAPDDTAVILFTSGSESFPKGVPLTHRNILTNLRDVTDVIAVRNDDRLLGMLPPFHSFGLTITLLLPACLGVRTVFAPDPTDGGTMAEMIDAYEVSLLLGTPTFLHNILRARSHADLSSLRLAVTGADKCPEKVYRALENRCPNATVLEGYGITECSPVVSVNEEEAPVEQTIGKVLPSLDYAIVDPETFKVRFGERGMLLLRGPSIFQGYLEDPAVDEDPFVEWEGNRWYETGDLVRETQEGVLEFCGRLKRFEKIGGEMISLPAIETVLEDHFPREDGEPQVAVESQVHRADGSKAARPLLVLFTTREDLDRQRVNEHIRNAGLSPLHNIKRVVHVDEIPQLGTGKTDHRALQREYL